MLAFTLAAGIGDIRGFPSAKKLCGHTGLCPRPNQSGDRDCRDPLTKAGPGVPALGDARRHQAPLPHPADAERDQRTTRRLGRQRGAKVAQIDIARKLSEAIWHILTNNQRFTPAPGGSTCRLAT